jgi:outer membrane protein assembly factor BamC
MKPFVKRYVLVAMLGAGAAVLAACASKEKKHEYETSPGQRSALEIPPDLTKPKTDGAIVVPDAATQPPPEAGASADPAPATKGDVIIGEPAPSSARSSRPGTVGEDVLPASDNIRLERAGGQRWLVVNAPPAQVWDMAREFLVAKDFKIVKASRETGIMETDWSESKPLVGTSFQKAMTKALGSKYSNSFRDRYRVRLERGKTPDTTEVYISHSGMEEVVASKGTDIVETRWQGRPNDPGLEAELLTQFLVHAGVKGARAQAIVNAPAPAPADEAALHIAGDKVSLQLRDTLDSAWKRVGLALDRVGWVVEDRTTDAHTYRVRQVDVVEPKKQKGFLGLFGDDEPVEKRREFLVALTENANLVEVTLRDASGVPVARKEAQPLMELLYGQLR